jgi:WD40 repeat protein
MLALFSAIFALSAAAARTASSDPGARAARTIGVGATLALILSCMKSERAERIDSAGSVAHQSNAAVATTGANLGDSVPHLAGLPTTQRAPFEGRQEGALIEIGHRSEIHALAFSDDGRLLASGGYDTTVIVWDVATGEQLRRLAGHHTSIEVLAFSPDGLQLVSADQAGAVHVWNTTTGAPVYDVKLGRLPHLAFDPKGRVWAAGGAAERGNVKVEVHDAATGATIRNLATDWSFVWTIAVTDSTVVAAGGDDELGMSSYGTLRVWDLASGQLKREHRIQPQEISPNGRFALIPGPFSRYDLFDVSKGDTLRTWRPPDMTYATLSPDGRHTLLRFKALVELWSNAEGAKEQAIGVPGENPVSVFSPDGKLLAMSGYTGSAIKIWNVETARELRTIYGQLVLSRPAISPDARWLVAATEVGVQVWDLGGAKPLGVLGEGPVDDVHFSADGRWLLWSKGARPGMPPYIEVRETKSWTRRAQEPTDRYFAGTHVAFGDTSAKTDSVLTGHAKRIAAAGDTLMVWGALAHIAVSGDHRYLANVGRYNLVDVWDLASGAQVTTLPGHSVAVNVLAFSQAHNRLMSLTQTGLGEPGLQRGDFLLQVYEAPSWAPLTELTFPFADGAPDAAITPDGSRVVYTEGRDSLVVYDLNEKKPVQAMVARRITRWDGRQAGNFAITPDGSILVETTSAGLRFWRLPPAQR